MGEGNVLKSDNMDRQIHTLDSHRAMPTQALRSCLPVSFYLDYVRSTVERTDLRSTITECINNQMTITTDIERSRNSGTMFLKLVDLNGTNPIADGKFKDANGKDWEMVVWPGRKGSELSDKVRAAFKLAYKSLTDQGIQQAHINFHLQEPRSNILSSGRAKAIVEKALEDGFQTVNDDEMQDALSVLKVEGNEQWIVDRIPGYKVERHVYVAEQV